MRRTEIEKAAQVQRASEVVLFLIGTALWKRSITNRRP
jgi:hypothetical protein